MAIPPKPGIQAALTNTIINLSCSQSTNRLNTISIIVTVVQYIVIQDMARHLAMAMIFTSQTILTLTQVAILK